MVEKKEDYCFVTVDDEGCPEPKMLYGTDVMPLRSSEPRSGKCISDQQILRGLDPVFLLEALCERQNFLRASVGPADYAEFKRKISSENALEIMNRFYNRVGRYLDPGYETYTDSFLDDTPDISSTWAYKLYNQQHPELTTQDVLELSSLFPHNSCKDPRSVLKRDFFLKAFDMLKTRTKIMSSELDFPPSKTGTIIPYTGNGCPYQRERTVYQTDLFFRDGSGSQIHRSDGSYSTWEYCQCDYFTDCPKKSLKDILKTSNEINCATFSSCHLVILFSGSYGDSYWGSGEIDAGYTSTYFAGLKNYSISSLDYEIDWSSIARDIQSMIESNLGFNFLSVDCSNNSNPYESDEYTWGKILSKKVSIACNADAILNFDLSDHTKWWN